MITLISFIIILFGAANWLIIGLMQYDFVAGIFGTQSSLLSRLVYILIGVAAIWILLMAIVQKGRIKINDNGFRNLNKIAPVKNKNQNQQQNNDPYQNYEYSSKQQPSQAQTAPHEYSHPNSVDAGQEFHQKNNSSRTNPFD